MRSLPLRAKLPLSLLYSFLFFQAVAATRGEDPLPTPLTIEAAVERALAANEISGIAEARLEGAAALRRQAVAQLLPALTLTGNATLRAREVTREIDGDEVVVQARNAY